MALTLLASNNASSVLAAGISASATTLTVNTGTGALFPAPVASASYFKLTLVDAATGTLTEIVHVTAVSGDVFTVARGQEGTTARIWSANDIAANMFTSGTLAALLQTNNYLSEIKAAGVTAVASAVANLGLGTGLTGVIGDARNAKMSVTAASATATFTADELIVGIALGGLQYRLGSFSKTINLATTGAGGMDTGTVPASGYVALYAIYNPTTQASALLAVNTTSSIAPAIYGGANMPAGYTASALVSVWRTTSSQFVIGYQQDRKIDIARANAFVGSSNNSSQVALSISGYVPSNAKMIYGDVYYNSTSSGDSLLFSLSPTSGIVGQLFFRGVPNANQAMYKINIQIAQSVYYSNTGASSSPVFAISLSGYEI